MNLNSPSGCWVELEQWCKTWRLQSIDTQVLLTKKFLSCNGCISQLLPMNQDILIRLKQLQTLDPDWIFHFLWCRCTFINYNKQRWGRAYCRRWWIGWWWTGWYLGGGRSAMWWLGHAGIGCSFALLLTNFAFICWHLSQYCTYCLISLFMFCQKKLDVIFSTVLSLPR